MSSLSSNLEKAHKANEYVRSLILRGSTQLENNNLGSNEQKMALNKAVNDIRTMAQTLPDFELELNKAVASFFFRCQLAIKYSFGNCSEMARLALFYMYQNAPSVAAEVYMIEGGDHAFLVVGKKKSCDDSDPTTWGDGAVICDPWVNKVYPASDYLKELNNFFRSYPETGDVSFLNCIEPFNSSRHRLLPNSYVPSSQYLQEKKGNRQEIEQQYVIFAQYYQVILEQFVDELSAIEKRLTKRYGSDNFKVNIMKEKINFISQLQREFQRQFSNISGYEKEDVDWKKDLRERLLQGADKLGRNLNFSVEHNNLLLEHQNPNSFQTMFMRFFGISPTSSRESEVASENCREALTNMRRF